MEVCRDLVDVYIFFKMGGREVGGWLLRVFYNDCRFCWGDLGDLGSLLNLNCFGFGVGLWRSFFNVVSVGDLGMVSDVDWGGERVWRVGNFGGEVGGVRFGEVGMSLCNWDDCGGEVIWIIWGCREVLRGVFRVCLIVLCFVCLCMMFYCSVDVCVFRCNIVVFSIVMFVSNCCILLGRLFKMDFGRWMLDECESVFWRVLWSLIFFLSCLCNLIIWGI